MDEFEIDEETANLILKTYNKIYAVKRILEQEQNQQISAFTDSGDKLVEMMNEALKSRSQQLLESKIEAISEHIMELRENSDKIQTIENSKELINLYAFLSDDLRAIQLRIKAEK